jgi:transposase
VPLLVVRGGHAGELCGSLQYGALIGAFVVYLLHVHFLPEDRLAELMGDLFGVRLVPATIARISHNCARQLQEFMAAVRARVNEAKVKHLDETGFSISSKTRWLHIASTGLLTLYRISGSRGSMPEHVSGTIVHDHWKPYYTMTGRAARLAQGSLPARVAGADRHREGRLGAQDAGPAATRLPRDKPRPRV